MPTTLRALYRTSLDNEDLASAELWELGTLGLTSRQVGSGDDAEVEIEAYFSPSPDGPAEHAIESAKLLSIGPLPEVDWLARYRESVQPFAIGERLWLDPREPEEAPLPIPDGRLRLRLPARSAFGTGSHESTRLALELIEDLAALSALVGKSVLEVGAGTGVLSFAARAFGAERAIAFDLDPAAPFHARDNARLNGLPIAGFAGRTAALRPSAQFDFVLLNVLPEEIFGELGDVIARVAHGGELVFSGILAERGDEILARVAEFGLVERGRRMAGEWVAFRLDRG